MDLRQRVVAAFRSGMSRLETATLFKVSESSVQRWARLDREKGDLAPQPMGGRRPFVLANERDRILERIAQQPDLPLRELLAELQGRGIEVSYLGFHAQTLEIFDILFDPRFGPNAIRFRRKHSLKGPFSGMFLNRHRGRPRPRGHETTPAKHHFRESWSRWPIDRPKFRARSPNRPASKFSRV